MSEGSGRVLVVEDDQLVRSFLNHALRRRGWELDEAATAGEALAHLERSDHWAAMLIDGLLPDMHGLVLARRVLQHNHGADVPICFITGALVTAPPMMCGISVMPKPVRATALWAHLEELEAWRTGGGSRPEERREALRSLEAEFLVGP